MNIWSLEVYCISICIGRVSNKSGANKHPVSSKHIIWYMFFCKFTTPKKTWTNMKKTHTQEKSLRTPDFFQMISSFCHPRGWRFPGSSHERTKFNNPKGVWSEGSPCLICIVWSDSSWWFSPPIWKICSSNFLQKSRRKKMNATT